MTPHSGYPSISGEVCWSFQSGKWLIGVVCAQTSPVMGVWSERTVCIIGWEQRWVSEWVGCECSSSEIQSRNNVENLGHFYRYVFPRKLSFQAFYSWLSQGGFLCISHPIFVGERFFPASLTLFTRGSCSLLLSDEHIQGLCARFNIQGPEHCDDSEQGSYIELLLMRVYCWRFHIRSCLPQLFCRCLSSPALIFRLNWMRL